jgi:hypothetical protein
MTAGIQDYLLIIRIMQLGRIAYYRRSDVIPGNSMKVDMDYGKIKS